ncbi:DUF6804 family protein [Caldisericum sp.]|uniref:DUF6804 family protein n=1 Tax=Caldisericum sp. TaxID=2499687 RepID=UPI003D1291A1
MDNKIIKYKQITSIVAILILLLAIPSGVWSYGYYQILRWIVAGVALFIAYVAYRLEKQAWIWIMAVIAILFNPIAPIYLSKETWVTIDLIASIIFLISIFKIKNYK